MMKKSNLQSLFIKSCWTGTPLYAWCLLGYVGVVTKITPSKQHTSGCHVIVNILSQFLGASTNLFSLTDLVICICLGLTSARQANNILKYWAKHQLADGKYSAKRCYTIWLKPCTQSAHCMCKLSKYQSLDQSIRTGMVPLSFERRIGL